MKKYKNSKKTSILLLLLMLIFMSLIGCSKESSTATTVKTTEETILFTDSCGREVEIPKNLTKVAPSGSTAQMILMTIAPETLVGLASTPSSNQLNYFPEDMWYLPTFGQFYGSKANLNMEALIDAEPQVIIDIGDKKETHKADMDTIQKQTGIPTIFVEANLSTFAQAYRTLGELFGKEEKGEGLASYVEETMKMAEENRKKITEKRTVLYGTGSTGQNCNASGSVQADVIEEIGAENAIVTEEINNSSGGTFVNMEEVYRIDPDVLIFTSGGPFERIDTESTEWSDLSAVKDGNYFEVPQIPYCWMSNPPSVNRIIGIWWLGNLVYPELYDYDMVEEAQRFYKLFWDYDLSEEEATQMLKNSTLKNEK